MVSGAALRDIAERFQTSKASLSRHRPHLSAAVAKVASADERKRGRTLLEDIRLGEQRADGLRQQAEQVLVAALQEGDRRRAIGAIRAALAALAEARGYAGIRGQMTNELAPDRSVPTFHVQIMSSHPPT
jgi:hypothetical protein